MTVQGTTATTPIASNVPHLVILSSGGRGHGIPCAQLMQYLITTKDCRITMIWHVQDDGSAPPSFDSLDKDRMRAFVVPKPKLWTYHHKDEFFADIDDFILESGFGPITAFIMDFFVSHVPDLLLKYQVPMWQYFTSPLIAMYPLVKYKMQRIEPFDIPGIGTIELTDLPGCTDPALRQLMLKVGESYKYSEGMLVNDTPRWYHPDFLGMVDKFERPELNAYVSLDAESEPTTATEASEEDDERARAVKPLQKSGYWPIISIGPLADYDVRSVTNNAEHSEVLAWLSDKPNDSVLLVTLGSWGSLPPKDLVELGKGLEMSGRYILWAHRKPDYSMISLLCPTLKSGLEVPQNVDPGSGLPLDLDTSRMKIVRWLHQKEILQHPAIGAFVTHCGWNSTIEAFALRGLPLMALPISADQMIIAKFLSQSLKVGPRLWYSPETDSLDRKRVADCIEEVFNNHKELAERAQHYKTMINEPIEGEIDKFWSYLGASASSK